MNWNWTETLLGCISILLSVVGYLLKLNINNVMGRVKENEALLGRNLSDVFDLKDRATEIETEMRIRVEISEQSRIRLEKSIADMREEFKESLHDINTNLRAMWDRLDRK